MNLWQEVRSRKRMFSSDPVLINLIGLAEATILCRIAWDMFEDSDWIEATHRKLETRTGISEKVQRRAIGILKSMGLLEVKENRLLHRTSYRVNWQKVNELEPRMLKIQREWDGLDIEDRDAANPELTKEHLANLPYPPSLPTGRRSTPNGNVATLPTGSSTLYGTELDKEKECDFVDSDESTPLLEDSETDSPEAPEAPPQDQAEAPPPAGPRRAPRMPPPRQNALGSFETSRDAETDEDAAPPTKTSPTRQSQRRQSGFSGDKANQVAVAWNKLSAAAGLPGILQLTKPRAKALAQRLRDPVWLENWEAALAQVPKADWRTGKNDRQWRATFDWFVRPDTVAKLIEERDAAAPVTGPAPAPKPKSKFPVGSPEWEKEMLSR